MANNPEQPTKPSSTKEKAQKRPSAVLGLFVTLGLVFTLLALYWFSTGQILPNGRAIGPATEVSGQSNQIIETEQVAQSSQQNDLTSQAPTINTAEPISPTDTVILSSPTPAKTQLPDGWLPALALANACANELNMEIEIDSFTALWKWLPQAIGILKNSSQIPSNCRNLSQTYGHHGLNDLLSLAGGENWWNATYIYPICDSIEGCMSQCSADIGYSGNVESINDQLAFNIFLAETYPNQTSNSPACASFQKLIIQQDFDLSTSPSPTLSEVCQSDLLPQSVCGGMYTTPSTESCAVFLESATTDEDFLEGLAIETYASSYGDLPNECLSFLSNRFIQDQIYVDLGTDLMSAANCLTTETCSSNDLSGTSVDLAYACVIDMGWNANGSETNSLLNEIFLAAPWLNIPLSQNCISILENTGTQTAFWQVLATITHNSK